MGGPAYDPVPGNASVFRFPNSFKGVPLFYEWSRDYIKEFRLNGRRLAEIRPFPVFVDNPMDMEFGPDGSLTCSSTATGSSPKTRMRSWRRSTSSAGTTRRS